MFEMLMMEVVMTVERKDGSETYRKIKFNYSVYGENGLYGGNATITVHYGSYTKDTQLGLNVDFDTLDKAEEVIIKSVKLKIYPLHFKMRTMVNAGFESCQ
jgi:hypothetical protein